MNKDPAFALRRNFLKVVATTAGVWGVGAQAQQAKTYEPLQQFPADDLQLKAGSEVVALVKSTEVSIARL
jgi:hypothetical protein